MKINFTFYDLFLNYINTKRYSQNFKKAYNVLQSYDIL